MFGATAGLERRMLQSKTHKSVTTVVALLTSLSAVSALSAANLTPPPGAITGTATLANNVPAVGASVILFNRQNHQVGKVTTDVKGEFRMYGLVPSMYTIKVVQAALAPVTKQLLVQPGMRSVLAIHLTAVLSTIQFAYPPIENGSIMTDEWKWVLRSASATRPILRFAGEDASVARGVENPDAALASLADRPPAISDMHGVLRVSAGQGPLSAGVGNEADLGTAFALATSLAGSGSLLVSGNLGYGSATGVPTAAFRTSYSREIGGGTPEISLTMRQLFLPGRIGAAITGAEPGALPMLRSMSAGLDDSTQVADNVTLQYGFTMDSVAFLDHLNYFSPYARLVADLGNGAELVVAYSSGNARPGLDAAAGDDLDLQRGINALGVFPLISLRNSRTEIQRGNEYQVTYLRKVSSRTFRGSVFRQQVSNAALTMVAPAGMFSTADVLPDLFSGSSVFNAGNFQSNGYAASVTQNLGSSVTATVDYSDAGALTANSGQWVAGTPDELRRMIHEGRRRAATTRIAAVLPWAGTHVAATYQFTADKRAVMAGNIYTTDSFQPAPGLNVMIRQPIPGFSKRIEATADLRNILAQGYLPIPVEGGQQILLVQNPRSVRGGLSFIF